MDNSFDEMSAIDEAKLRAALGINESDVTGSMDRYEIELKKKRIASFLKQMLENSGVDTTNIKLAREDI